MYLMDTVEIIGGGLAGCEAALQLAERGIPVRLHEMRPLHGTVVHEGDGLAQLVCSNSFKGTNIDSAAGLLKYELQVLGSQLLGYAFEERVPAGGALAIDRDRFSERVTRALEAHPLVTIERHEVTSLEWFITSGVPTIVAAGPLCSDALAGYLEKLLGSGNLAFFDAAAPVVESQSLDRDILFGQSRHGRGGGADYLNAPFDKPEYEMFIERLVGARRVVARDFEQRDLFSACQPVEEVARSGVDSLRFGAMKPVGLIDPRTGHRPWAVVQLRAENAERTALNLVGFQTNLTFGEQDRVFRTIPGLQNAVFSRHGVMHRNTFVDAPHVLDATFALPSAPNVRLAGQICGTEGYLEAVASGLLGALWTYAALKGEPAPVLPRESVLGALIAYATDPDVLDYQPMHVNLGIMPPLEPPVKRKRERYHAFSLRAQSAIDGFAASHGGLNLLAYSGPDMRVVSQQDGRKPAEQVALEGDGANG